MTKAQNSMSVSRRTVIKMAGGLAVGLGLPIPAASAVPFNEAMPAADLSGETPLPMLTLQLDWLLTTQFAGLMVAEASGLYQAQGLRVTLKPATADINVVEAVASSSNMLGSVEQAVLLDAQAKGAKVSAVATMLQSSPLSLISDARRPVSTPQELVGKRVGLHEDGLKALALILTRQGIDPQQVTCTLIPYTEKFEPLTSGQFDAIQCYALDEPLDYTRQTGQEPVLLRFSDFGFEAYAQVIFASNQLLAQSPDAVKSFLTATFEGWQRALQDIPSTAQLITTQYGESNVRDMAYQRETLKRLSAYVMPNQVKPGTIALTRWYEAAQQLADCGLIVAVPDQGVWNQGWVS